MHAVLATALGELTVVQEEGGLTGLYFPRHWPRPDRTAFGARVDDGFEDVARQLGEYLAGDRSMFELPLTVKGTEFSAAPASSPATRAGWTGSGPCSG
jgi:methylated-DNA-[protein]-cysteine S-methyltransferase